MYTNADQFRRKFSEFTVRITKEQPMLIGITEVKPKNSTDKLFPAEFPIDHIGDYDSPFHKNITTNIGRGILLYVHKQLQAKEVVMKTEFQEAIFVELNLNDKDKLLVGCIYRSESGTEENNRNLSAMIREATSKSYSHILMMGDFNYPDINWKNWMTKSENTENQDFRFIECIRDNFLSQHVQEPTRVRGNDTPNLLDLVFTNERNMIDSIEYQSPLGKSDHSVLSFKFKCYTVIKNYKKTKLYYNKADYNNIKRELKDNDWIKQLQHKNANEQWLYFKEFIRNLIDKYVPSREITQGQKRHNKPCDKKTLDKIREKHHLRRKAMETKDPLVGLQYNKIWNQVRRLTRNITKEYERQIAKNAKQNPKAIWRYINSKSKTKENIGKLLKDPTKPNLELAESDKEKAEILADYFSSVFTKEPEGPIPTLEGLETPEDIMEDVIVTEDEVKKVLQKLQTDKAQGPDQMHPYFLKETAEELALPLNIIFTQTLESSQVPEEWKKGRITGIIQKGQ